ncbi:PREDICTED: transmembrane protein 41 homolog isoform X1 [Papilio xuthus]|uniref:Transmembrane protein 41 homolog isoform X1 n=1 Tax=Papilio xuthus TaxID=66420 RepID=A0A194Q8K6_PAPXU|nr:PREDICTED: transmembrane protein 41 homolog isoform X1 [Papilio xuthus]KPJ01858.1 Transmembrane protein 41-like [Papilio xuthus]
MSAVERRARRTTENDVQGEIQDPHVSTTVDRPCQTKSRMRFLETEYTRLPYRPFPNSSYPINSTNTNDLSTSKALIIVAIIFGTSLLTLGVLYRQFPQLEESEKQYLKLPWDLEDAKNLGLVLDRYKDKYFHEVLLGVFLVYIFLQTFAIPGSIFLSILSGFLFPFYLALILVCCCSAIGASLCFFLSNLLGKKVVRKFFPERAAQWSKAVSKHSNNLLNYIIFLRVTPFLPNWFINMSAPVIGVPLFPFALGTFIGVAPPSFVAIQAGQTLHTLTSTSDAWSWTSVAVLTIFAFVSLIPVALKHKLKQKFE